MAKPGPGTVPSVPRFDKNSAIVQSHVQKIESEQLAVIGKAGSPTEAHFEILSPGA